MCFYAWDCSKADLDFYKVEKEKSSQQAVSCKDDTFQIVTLHSRTSLFMLQYFTCVRERRRAKNREMHEPASATPRIPPVHFHSVYVYIFVVSGWKSAPWKEAAPWRFHSNTTTREDSVLAELQMRISQFKLVYRCQTVGKCSCWRALPGSS